MSDIVAEPCPFPALPAAVAADGVVAHGPEKNGAGKVIEQHIGQGFLPEQGQIDRNAHKDGIGIGNTGAEQAEVLSLHMSYPAHHPGQTESDDQGGEGQQRAVEHVQQMVAVKGLQQRAHQKRRQGHIGHQPGQKHLAFRGKPALPGQSIAHRHDQQQAENSPQGVQKNHRDFLAAFAASVNSRGGQGHSVLRPLFCLPGTETLRLQPFGPPIVAAFIRKAALPPTAEARRGQEA